MQEMAPKDNYHIHNRNFLTARWEYLLMLNFSIDPEALYPYIPAGCELDLWEGKAIVSLVGFLFNNVRVWGVKWPFHTNFAEVNLRYYLKSEVDGTVQRGVGFISEIVPRRLITLIANTLYREHYTAMPVKHSVQVTADEVNASYSWQKGLCYSISVNAKNDPHEIAVGSEEEFILEHYYGFSKYSDTTTVSYEVRHPRWQIYPVNDFQLKIDLEAAYGKPVSDAFHGLVPRSVFLAKGSEVSVARPRKHSFIKTV